MDFSIVSCTYNPEPDIYCEVLKSCVELNYDQSLFEILIVDNGSDFSVMDSEYAKDLLGLENVRFIYEQKNGLTNARLRGYSESKGKYIVFVDDDNVLDTDYLVEVKKILKKNTHIGGIGPGRIEVVFKGNYRLKYKSYFKNIFQEKNLKRTLITNFPNSQENTLFGSGMIVHHKVLTEYFNLVKQGVLSATDRTKSNLVSSGDSQIVAVLIKMDYLIGFDPKIKLKHIISKRKSNFGYIKKLLYSISRYGLVSRIEVSKLYNDEISVEITKWRAFIVQFILIVITSLLTNDSPLIKVKVSQLIGNSEAQYHYVGKKTPSWLIFMKRIYGLNSY